MPRQVPGVETCDGPLASFWHGYVCTASPLFDSGSAQAYRYVLWRGIDAKSPRVPMLIGLIRVGVYPPVELADSIARKKEKIERAASALPDHEQQMCRQIAYDAGERGVQYTRGGCGHCGRARGRCCDRRSV